MSLKQPELSKDVRSALRLRNDGLPSLVTPNPEGTEGILHLNDLIPRLLARWHWILLCALLGLGAGFYQVWRAVPRYEVVSTVLVRDQNVNVLGQLDSGTDFDLRNMQVLETVRAGMATFDLCKAVASDPVVRDLKGLVPPDPKVLPFLGSASADPELEVAPPVAELATMIEEWLTVRIRPESRLIDVMLQHSDPRVAQTLANRVVDQYIQSRSESRGDDQKNSLAYLVAASKEVKQDLQTAQNLLASYTAPLDAEKALAAAETGVDTLGLRYRHKHPKMFEAQARLELTRERFGEALERAVRNPLDGDYWSAYHDRMNNPDDTKALEGLRNLLISRRAVLESEISSQDKLYGSLLEQIKTRELSSDTGQTAAEVTVQQSARLPKSPVYPRKSLVIVQATALGFFAGLGFAFLFQWLDNKFHTVADIESQLELPILAAIANHDEMKLAEAEKKGGPPGVGGGGDDAERARLAARSRWTPHLVFRVEGSNSHYAEMFRVLRTSISLLGQTSKRKVTMVTSALPSEGKSFVAANLAVALAQQGLKTLLVDLDLRKPSIHKMFGQSKDDHPGVVDLLTGSATLEEAVQAEPGQPNLYLVLSGPKAPNPGELLEHDRLEELLQQFEGHFDHIVFDTAPLLAVPDSRIIAPLAHNLAMVVRADSTSRGPVKRALEILRNSGITPEGIVFNDYTEKRFRIGKNYSYGYYRYGKDGYGQYGHGSTYGSVYGEDDEETS